MSDTARKQFRNYLEENGVTDSINRVLTALYDEADQPADPLEYIKQYLGAPKGVDPSDIEEQNANLEKEIKSLEAQIAAIKSSA